MSIINTFPTTISNGQVEDATVVMTLFSWIQSQTNGNACPATSGTAILKGNGSGGTVVAVAGTDYSAGTQALATGILKSTTSTGALSVAVAGTDYPPIASPTFTGTVTAPAFSGSLAGNAATATSAGSATSATNASYAATQAITDNSTLIATTQFVKKSGVGNGTQSNYSGTSTTGSPSSGTTYYNTTSNPISVYAGAALSASGSISAYLNGSLVAEESTGGGAIMSVCIASVPPGWGYSISCSAAFSWWIELR